MSPRLAYPALALLGLLSAATLSSCESSSVGTIDLDVSGVPLAGTQNVVLAITGVTVGGYGGQTDTSVSPEFAVDLDTGSRTAVQSALVPTGDYKWVRLQIDPADSYVIASNGDRYPLNVPSVFQSTGTEPFVVGESQTASMLVSVNLNLALSSETQDGATVYTLKPLSRLVNLQTVGGIVGTIPVDLMVGGLSVTDPRCDPEVYAYAGGDVVPAGYFVPVKDGAVPFTSATPVLHVVQAIYTFDVTLLPAGTYTVAVTCAAADVKGSTSIDFSPTQTVKVTTATNTAVTF